MSEEKVKEVAILSFSHQGRGEVSEAERLTLDSIRGHLRDARLKKASGQLTFEVVFNDGGIMTRFTTLRLKEK